MRLPPKEHYARLARKRVSVGVMIFHERKLLIVEPTYEPHYLVPGGGVDELETPRDAALRECKEELGLDIEIVRLLGVDETVYPESYRGDCLHFFFLAKDLTKAQVAAIKLPPDELKGFKFVTPDEAFGLLGNRIKLRMRASMDAIANRSSFYSENGKVI
jgi:8-oxo-dGTP diphosphatase